ncbi:MAG: MBL fold metallo-hydrolase [Chloroflexi bacterium]|nr:MBL fold metallo-hydrolase [Chloroflexota bacterium]
MKIIFHGAAQTVTGSQHLLEIDGSRLLLECGLFQGRRAETYNRNLEFPFDPASLEAVILSHAHIDHSGNLPNLVKNGYAGPIYATPATASLADIMLRDSGHIQEYDAQFINRKRAERGEPPVDPLYTQLDAARVNAQFEPVAYNESFTPVPGVQAKLVDAGHILGSASVSLRIEEHGRTYHVWFSGDIGRFNLPLLRDPILPDRDVDYLIMESTYGDKSHEPIEAAYQEFRQVVRTTVRKGGKVIIPAFAVGRTQELVYYLNRMIDSRDLRPVPVFVDSPLAVNATEIFEKYPDCYDRETHDFIRSRRHPALEFKTLSYTRAAEESKAINLVKGPAVIISASGMAENGRILHHLRNNIEDPSNMILIVSWQAPDTLGRRLAERQRQVRIFGETYTRRAGVATIGGLSSHAGQNLLVDYATVSPKNLRQVFLVHGEPRAAYALQAKLAGKGIRQVIFPERGQEIEI